MPHLSPRTLTEAEQRRLLKVRHGLHHVVKKMRVHDRDWIEIWYAVPNAKGPGEDLPGPSDVVHEPLRMAPHSRLISNSVPDASAGGPRGFQRVTTLSPGQLGQPGPKKLPREGVTRRSDRHPSSVPRRLSCPHRLWPCLPSASRPYRGVARDPAPLPISIGPWSGGRCWLPGQTPLGLAYGRHHRLPGLARPVPGSEVREARKPADDRRVHPCFRSGAVQEGEGPGPLPHAHAAKLPGAGSDSSRVHLPLQPRGDGIPAQWFMVRPDD